MKYFDNCNAEDEGHFNICWKCNYSFLEKKVIQIIEDYVYSNIDCLRCKIKMVYAGNYNFHEDPKLALMGPMYELLENRESFDLYLCPKCGKVEFFSPKK